MGIDRRDFLKLGCAAAAGAAGANAISAISKGVDTNKGASKQSLRVLTPEGKLVDVSGGSITPCCPPQETPVDVRKGGAPGRKWVMVIDLSKCDGCKSCTKACQAMHMAPPDREWIKVYQLQDAKETAPYWFPKPCFHCDNPPCTKVCPVNATFKRQDGTVLIDNERCIGCRFCMAACPYSTRYFNWERPSESADVQKQPYSAERGYPRRVGTVEKCDFCPDMAAKGQLPACVSVCEKGVIYYGDQNEDAVTNSLGETKRLSALLEERAGYRYMEELGTEPRVYYLPPKSRMFPAPEKKKEEEHKHK